jgi:hypothetical protein
MTLASALTKGSNQEECEKIFQEVAFSPGVRLLSSTGSVQALSLSTTAYGKSLLPSALKTRWMSEVNDDNNNNLLKAF